MHAVRKDCSTTTKLRIVFDASAKTSTGVSLNDTLLIGHTVHSSLVDVLLRFRCHRIALIADVSKMYRAIHLTEDDKDLHRFVWRKTPEEPLSDYRMTRVTFGVSASSFAANMSIKQNALELAEQYPLATRAVQEEFYVDDGLTGADSVEEAIELQRQLQELFLKGGFQLRKWNSSNPTVIEHLPQEIKGTLSSHTIPDPDQYTKTLGILWNSVMDHFQLTIAELPPLERVTKRFLVSDVAKTFDVLGWFSPSTIMVKVLLQRLWEQKIEWDEEVPLSIKDVWLRWRSELKLLATKHIPRYYFSKQSTCTSFELHGFCDASEAAYAAVVYFRTLDSKGNPHISLITSKTKVAPIKRLTIPRLELCGAHLLARLLHHLQRIFNVPIKDVHAWTDSTIVLGWIVGDPRRFKTFVGNRVSELIDYVPPGCWRHVDGVDNPADCASRGLLPSELLKHDLWWNGPKWLLEEPNNWPECKAELVKCTDEERGVCLVTSHVIRSVVPFDRYSSYAKLKMVVAWVFRFLKNSRIHLSKETEGHRVCSPYLTVDEIASAENQLLMSSQADHFQSEITALQAGIGIDRSSCLISLNPFLDSSQLLRVGGRQELSRKPYDRIHPIILHGKHPLVRLIVRAEHILLMHGGPTLIIANLSRRFHIIGGRKIVRSIIRQCIQCKKVSAIPLTQKMGNLPIERITPDRPFANVGVDYAGPFHVKYGYVRKPTIVKAYACVFVSLSIKAVHIELVTDLTTEAFIACLRRFIARRGRPTLIMSDNGSNFVGASRELKELKEFFELQRTKQKISQFCSLDNIKWQFIPERAPHFGGLWEGAVKSMKTHLRRVVGEYKLTFEELYTVMTQVEACLNSRPLAPLPHADECLEALTPGHFIIGQPLEALPDPSESYLSISLLKRWHLVQLLVRHFWQRWSTEYLATLSRVNKWRQSSPNVRVGDIVIIKDDALITPSKWPLAKIIETHPGKDKHVRVVTVKTANGVYKRPITKIVPLLSPDN